jgi:UDP-N-acetyl-D-glucosamine dehydrogenase
MDIEGMEQELCRKLRSREARVGIVGLGYVGIPLASRYCAEGYQVVGFDVDATKVASLQEGRSYIRHISNEVVQEMTCSGLEVTTDFSKVAGLDAIILCVPTPLTKNREPDLAYVRSAVESLAPHLRAGQVLALESTTYPGTTEEELVPLADRLRLEAGKELFFVYSPEREDPGRKDYTTKTIPKVCSGYTEACRRVGEALYGEIVDRVVVVSSLRAAEMTKLLENIHRAVNIGLVNELKIVCDKMGIDTHEVISAAATKPFGFVPYRPGPGLGGHCIPIDPFYLTWKAREYGVNTKFIELAGEVNRAMPHFVVRKVQDALNNAGKALQGARVCIVGLAYKKNVDDYRESPALEIIEELASLGAHVTVLDPYVEGIDKITHGMASEAERTPAFFAKQDCCVIVTDHDDVPYDDILAYIPLIVDTRGRYRMSLKKVVAA